MKKISTRQHAQKYYELEKYDITAVLDRLLVKAAGVLTVLVELATETIG